MDEWCETELSDTKSLERVDMKSKMTQATVHVIASAGFGIRAAWSVFDVTENHDIDRSRPKNGLLPFHTALLGCIDKFFLRALTPKKLEPFLVRIPGLSTPLKTMQLVFSNLEVHMRNLVNAHRSDTMEMETGSDGETESLAEADLLQRLVKANDAMQESGKDDEAASKKLLTDGELFSNIFVSISCFA